MGFIHTTGEKEKSDIVKWTFNILPECECEIFANDSLIFEIAPNGDIKMKNDEGWVKIAKLIKCPHRGVSDLTTDYK